MALSPKPCAPRTTTGSFLMTRARKSNHLGVAHPLPRLPCRLTAALYAVLSEDTSAADQWKTLGRDPGSSRSRTAVMCESHCSITAASAGSVSWSATKHSKCHWPFSM